MNVSAVIVTRGDVDLSATLDSLPRDWQKVVWDNSRRQDLAVYGRYAAIEECEHDAIFVVDDDVVLGEGTAQAIADAYQSGAVVANMPQRFRDTGFYDDHCLVGFGAIFQRDVPLQAFKRFGYQERPSPDYSETWAQTTAPGKRVVFPDRRLIFRTCDIIVTGLTPRVLLDLPYSDREYASAPNRMWRQSDHVGERARMLELVRQVAG